MSILTNNPQAKAINTPGGKIRVCETPKYGNPWDGSAIKVELEENEGGVTLPSGINVYTISDTIFWSSHYGFLNAGQNVKEETRVKTKLTKTRHRALRFNDPAILELSDLLYDLLLTGQLPMMKFFETGYLKDRQKAIYDYCEKMRAIDIALADLNAFSQQERDSVYAQVDPTAEHSRTYPRFRPVKF